MNPLRENPHLLEVNARLWVSRLAAREGRALSLSTIPTADLEAVAKRFDLLWLMGPWRRSESARKIAMSAREIIPSYDAALPGWSTADVDGSPYAIAGYELDPRLGRPNELRTFRDALHSLGLRLIVDFVPNHLALDHPWTREQPECFVHGTDETVRSRPGQFFRTAGGDWLAHGRDPNFPPWKDTVQVDFFSPEARRALLEEVLSIAEVADGVRCDMAMLGLSDVFEQVWGWALRRRQRPRQEFWGELIGRVKTEHPDFLFIAEAYWGLENRLLELGFDDAYDKRLYDLFLGGSASEIRQHLAASGPLLHAAVRFIENHDERRATVAFGRERSQNVAIATMTLPGLRLVHDGQIEGKRIRLPVQLIREPVEPVDGSMVRFYDHLLALTSSPPFREGTWRLVDAGPSRLRDDSHRNIVSWSWTHRSTHYLVAVNQSKAPAHGRLCPPPGLSWPTSTWKDLIEPPGRTHAEPCESGVDVHLRPWSAQLLSAEADRGAAS